MPALLMANEAAIRLTFFLAILAVMAGWEVAAPRRSRQIPRRLRWANNLGVVVINTLLVRLAFPILAVGLAIVAEEHR
ncbi:hypothetical protein [Reyranella sp.]|uniref:hypothetical protein n=1 Tax=Reyranella sp. TaxID=1929291 RepID=UPI00272F3933|nr:hypothetical protein [Reyranella sp.]MDP2375659.1 hypothetical protein [Reyranella sp.]